MLSSPLKLWEDFFQKKAFHGEWGVGFFGKIYVART